MSEAGDKAERGVGTALFEAQVEFARAEGRMNDLLDKALGEDGWDGLTFDYYDASIEVYRDDDCDDAVAEKLKSALVGTGVQKLYLHEHPQDSGRDKCQGRCRLFKVAP